jgi:Rrf2 family protein
MKLQKASRYALYAVLHLASEPGKQFSTAEIAEAYDVSIHHLAKVMRTLVRSGLIESHDIVGHHPRIRITRIGYRHAG